MCCKHGKLCPGLVYLCLYSIGFKDGTEGAYLYVVQLNLYFFGLYFGRVLLDKCDVCVNFYLFGLYHIAVYLGGYFSVL
ncbi:membrane protein [Candidatus Magnetobacterium bavaricum]|uniref:Membrane protein n=1 Tax=Candidatus Magnetobacterium bavaricum TaxID=29290 RepID=A0A0F3H0H9_9BACT|nr:membrane protein [Candidatus Magnetobacterium bavaricum]